MTVGGRSISRRVPLPVCVMLIVPVAWQEPDSRALLVASENVQLPEMLSGAVESTATTLPEIIQEMLLTKVSERQGRAIDKDQSGSMEKKKREGYF